jgi:hypothetical protein
MSASKNGMYDYCNNGIPSGCGNCEQCDPEFYEKQQAEIMDGLKIRVEELKAERNEAIAAKNLAERGIAELNFSIDLLRRKNEYLQIQGMRPELLELLHSAEANCQNMLDRLALLGVTGVSYADIVKTQIRMAVDILEKSE